MSYAIDTITGVSLGQQGESLVTTIEIDCTAWLEDDPDLELHIVHIRHGETVPYTPATTMDTDTGMVLQWPVTAADTGVTGTGAASVIGIDGSRVKKSRTFRTKVGTIVPGSEEDTPPSTVSGWVDQVVQAAQVCLAYAEDFTNLQDEVAGKQDQLTFDDSPTAGSTNPVTSTGIKTALDAKGWIRVSAAGDPCTIEDAEQTNVISLQCHMGVNQNLNGYDRPWAPGSWVNKVNLGETYTATESTTLATLTLAAGTYTLSATVSNTGSAAGRLRVQTSLLVYGEITIATTDSAVRKSVTFTLPSDSEINVVLNGASNGYNLTASQVQIQTGSSMTDYVPYKNICECTPYSGITVSRLHGSTTTSLQSTFAHEVYGGDYISTGELYEPYMLKSFTGGFSMSEDGVFYTDDTFYRLSNVSYCNMYRQGRSLSSITGALSYAKQVCWIYSNSRLTIVIYDPTYTSAAAFNTMIQQETLNCLCHRATSEEYTATAITAANVYGENIWSHNCNGTVSVTYKANTKLYIDTRIQALQDQIDNL